MNHTIRICTFELIISDLCYVIWGRFLHWVIYFIRHLLLFLFQHTKEKKMNEGHAFELLYLCLGFQLFFVPQDAIDILAVSKCNFSSTIMFSGKTGWIEIIGNLSIFDKLIRKCSIWSCYACNSQDLHVCCKKALAKKRRMSMKPDLGVYICLNNWVIAPWYIDPRLEHTRAKGTFDCIFFFLLCLLGFFTQCRTWSTEFISFVIFLYAVHIN